MEHKDESMVFLCAFHTVHLYGEDIIILCMSYMILIKMPFF